MILKDRDWVQLSSYLDGELSPREMKQMKERINNESDLQSVLEELRQTKITLGAAPKLKVPRNFTLGPDMVASKPRQLPARRYSLAAALMSFMLMGVLFLDFGRGFMSGAMAPAAPKEFMMEAVPESAADVLDEPAVMLAEGEIVEDRSTSGTDADNAQEDELPAPAVASEAIEEEALGMAQESESTDAAETAADSAEKQADEWQQETGEELASPTGTLVIEVSDTPVPQIPAPTYYDNVSPRIDRMPRIQPLRVLEVIFALGAVSFGIAALASGRRKN